MSNRRARAQEEAAPEEEKEVNEVLKEVMMMMMKSMKMVLMASDWQSYKSVIGARHTNTALLATSGMMCVLMTRSLARSLSVEGFTSLEVHPHLLHSPPPPG